MKIPVNNNVVSKIIEVTDALRGEVAGGKQYYLEHSCKTVENCNHFINKSNIYFISYYSLLMGKNWAHMEPPPLRVKCLTK